MNKVSRGTWSIFFWIACISNLSLAVPVLMSGQMIIPSTLIIAFWLWRIKFVFYDLNHKWVRVDFWIAVFLVILKAGVTCFSLFVMSNALYFGVWGMAITHEGLPAMYIGILFYGFITPLFLEGDSAYAAATYLSFGFNPIVILYMITEGLLLRRLNKRSEK